MTPYTDQATKRRALPLDQTVKWLPLHDAYYLLAEVMTSTRAAPLVVLQEALLHAEAHASSEVYGSTCGVLCGGQYRDPKSGATYLLVEGIERAARIDRDGDPDASLAADLSRAIASAERAGRTVVGWYRFDVALSHKIPAADTGIHRSLFPEPWQVALLRDGSDGEGSGAFIRVEPTEGRAFPIPFFELIPRKRARARGPKRTSIQWRSYSAESPVVPLPVGAFQDASPRRVKKREPSGASQSSPLAGVFARWSARRSAAGLERPIIPRAPREPAAPSEAPLPVVDEVSPPEAQVSPPEDRVSPPEAQVSPPEDRVALPEERQSAPDNPVRATAEDPVWSPEDPVRIPEDRAMAPEAPADELDALFTEWRPDAGERISLKAFGVSRSRSVSGAAAKRAIAAVALLAVAYVGVQRVRAVHASRRAIATGEVAAQQTETQEVATGRLADAEATPPADRPSDGSFTPEERADVRSALARISQSRTALAARLDTLESALATTSGGAGAAGACARAGSLYQRSLDDLARIDLARQKLASLVGPMRMAGIDSLSRKASDLHPRLRDVCPR